MREPISAVTALAYVATGAALVTRSTSLEAIVFAVALAFLAFGTGLFHARKSERTRDFDHAGMNAALVALATYAAGGTWWLMAVGAIAAAVVVEFMMDHPNRVLMGAMVWIGLVAAFAAGNVWELMAAIVLMGSGFALWQFETDWAHGAWHVLTAAGMGLLFTVV